MTYQEIAQMIAAVGLPYAYDHFTEQDTPGAPPFICFFYSDSDNFHADNGVYQKVKTLSIELYTDNKDIALEERVEAVLDGYDLGYDSSETYLDSEKMYMVTWETDVIITKGDD